MAEAAFLVSLLMIESLALRENRTNPFSFC